MSVTVLNSEKIIHMLGYAPEAATEYMRRWLYHERREFVGNKKKDGQFRRSLQRRKLRGRPGTWPKNVSRIFKGYVKSHSNLNGMELHMGAGLNNPTKFTKGITAMERGFETRPTSKSYMPMPFYSNLMAAGYANKYGKLFREHRAANKWDIVPVGNGKILFFEKGGHEHPLFIGVRKARIKKTITFTDQWSRRIPQSLKRGERYLDTAMRNIDRADKKQWSITGE